MMRSEILNQPLCFNPLFQSAQIARHSNCNFLQISTSSTPVLTSFPKHNNLFAKTIHDSTLKSTLIQLQGHCLECYITQKRRQKQYPILTQQCIQYLVNCLSHAFLTLKELNIQGSLTHLKQYCIRMDSDKKVFKLIFYEDMVSQIQAGSQNVEWDRLYLSPEQLEGQFVEQKSIIFSFGLILLNICSCDLGVRDVYQQNFTIDEDCIKQKLRIARSQFGYSNLLINLIEQCLQINLKRRLCFLGLVENFNRRQKQKNMRFSDLVSQYGRLSDTNSISYTLNFGSPRKSSQKIGSKNSSTENENSAKTEASEKKIVQTENQNENKDGGKVKKKKKGLSKFEFTNTKLRASQKQEPKDKSANLVQQKEQTKHQTFHIDYRGTFGQRLDGLKDRGERNSLKSTKIKQSSKKKKQQISQQEPNAECEENQVQQTQNKQQIDRIKTISKENLIPNPLKYSKEGENKSKIAIQILQANINNQNSEVHEEVETPRGFGKFMLGPQKEVFESSENNFYFGKILTHDQIPEPITQMEHISLSQCLSAHKQFPITFKNKVGVWIEGDLYYGDFSKGRRSGLGLQIFSNEEYYYGFFLEDLFSGEGFYFWNEKEYFFGKFQLGKKVWGRLEGEVKYQGGFEGNKRQGQGICWYPNGEVYIGNWVNGKRDGKGILFYPDLTIFQGNWSKGRKKGFGIFKADLMQIEGEWNNQKIEGQAQIKYQNGDYFRGKVGQFLDKVKGEYRSNSGNIFVGDFENEQPKNGQFLYSNGDKYIGQFLNGRRHGYGEYYYKHGEIYKGYWENNKKKC